MSQGPVSPVTFDIEYPESLSRLHLLLKSFLGWIYVGIPHGTILTALGFVVWIVSIVAFFGILFTGRYPRGLFNLVVGYYRWGARVNAYSGFMVDNYPPFSLNEDDSNPVGLRIEYPERLSRKMGSAEALPGVDLRTDSPRDRPVPLFYCGYVRSIPQLVGDSVHREISQGILQLHSGDAPVGTQG